MSDNLPATFGPHNELPRKGGTSLVSKELKRILGQRPKGRREGATYAELLAKVMVTQALQGKHPFMREVLDRTEGKVADRIAGSDGGPLGLDTIVQALDRIYGPQEAKAVECRLLPDHERDDEEQQ